MPAKTAILVVNGFDRFGKLGPFDAEDARRYPWIEVCLREVERRSAGTPHEVLVWDNSQIEEHREVARSYGARLFPENDEVVSHPQALNRLVQHVGPDVDFVVSLDTDAFPVRDDWLEVLTGSLDAAALTGVWRDEMEAVLTPFVHPSCLCVSRERLLRMTDPFAVGGVQDVGQRITLAVQASGGTIIPQRRSNVRNAHFLLGGIYGDIVYHHGAGSRRPVFRLTEGPDRDEAINIALREAVFSDLDGLVSVLRGQSDAKLGLDWERPEPVISDVTAEAIAKAAADAQGPAAPDPRAIPRTLDELAALEARYVPFAGADAWADLEVDTARWDRYVARLERAREAAGEPRTALARDGLLRAAALDSAALSGMLAPSGELTAVVISAGLEGRAGEEISESLEQFLECNRQALALAEEAAADGRTIDQPLVGNFYTVVTAVQQTFTLAMPDGQMMVAELPRDRYKPVSNYLTVSGELVPFCPASRVPEEMARYVAELASDAFAGLHPVVQAAYAHHALAIIHPFSDANGRVARTVASIPLFRAAGVPLLVFGDQWPQYRAALDAANRGDRQATADRFFGFALQAVDLATALLSTPVLAAVTSAGEVDEMPALEAAALDLVRDVLWVELHDVLPTPPAGTLLSLGELPAAVDARLEGHRVVGATAGFHGIRAGLAGAQRRELVFVPVVADDASDRWPVGILEVNSGDLFEATLADTHPFALQGVTLRLRAWVNRLVTPR